MTAELTRYWAMQGPIKESLDGEYVRFADVEAYAQAAVAAGLLGAVKPLKWVDLGLGWAAYDPLFEAQVITEELAKYDAERATRILSALSIPADAAAAMEERDKRVRDDVLEQAAQEIEAVTDWDYATQNDLAAAIRAMKGGK